jgi:hypothetical protein
MHVTCGCLENEVSLKLTRVCQAMDPSFLAQRRDPSKRDIELLSGIDGALAVLNAMLVSRAAMGLPHGHPDRQV